MAPYWLTRTLSQCGTRQAARARDPEGARRRPDGDYARRVHQFAHRLCIIQAQNMVIGPSWTGPILPVCRSEAPP